MMQLNDTTATTMSSQGDNHNNSDFQRSWPCLGRAVELKDDDEDEKDDDHTYATSEDSYCSTSSNDISFEAVAAGSSPTIIRLDNVDYYTSFEEACLYDSPEMQTATAADASETSSDEDDETGGIVCGISVEAAAPIFECTKKVRKSMRLCKDGECGEGNEDEEFLSQQQSKLKWFHILIILALFAGCWVVAIKLL